MRFVIAQLPQNEVIEDALRKEVKLAPEVVVRELVANALIHQDIMVGGASVMVEVCSNRVEISNPSEPVVPVERFIDGYQSRGDVGEDDKPVATRAVPFVGKQGCHRVAGDRGDD